MPIYDQTFRPYAGKRSTSFLWWPIARQTLRHVLKSKLTWFLMSGVVIPVVVLSVGFFVTAKIKAVAPEHTKVASQVAESTDLAFFSDRLPVKDVTFTFLMWEFGVLWLMVLTTGGGSVSTEKRNQALPLYFSRPLGVRDYMIGKILGLALFPALVLSTAVLLLLIQCAAYADASISDLVTVGVMIVKAMVYILLICFVTSLSMAAFSSAAATARSAGIMYLGFWFTTLILGRLLARLANSPAPAAISPARSLQAIARQFFHPADRYFHGHRRDFIPIDIQTAVLALTVYCVVFLLVFRRNLKVVEVVK